MTQATISVTPGTGAQVVFDSDGAGTPSFSQQVKLGQQVAGSNVLAPGDATDGLYVQVRGSGAAQLGKLIDNAVGGTDLGVGVLGKRVDAPATITPANGDYSIAQLSKRGSLWVEPVDNTATGNLTSTTSITMTDLMGASAVGVDLRGFGTATIQFEASIDGTNFFAVQAAPVVPGALVTSATAAGSWQCDVAGYAQFRCRCSAYTSGTIAVTIRASVGTGLIGMDQPLPAGTNAIGTVDTELPAAAAMSDTISRTLTTPQVGALLMLDNASNYVRAPGDVTGGLVIQGPVADDGVLAGKPLRIGVKATAASPSDMSADGDVVTLAADRSGLLYVRPFNVTAITVTPTASTTPAYASNDQVGGVMTFAGVARKNAGIGRIISAVLMLKSSSLAAATSQLMYLHLFHNRTSAPTIASTDNAAFDLTDANLTASGEFLGSFLFNPTPSIASVPLVSASNVAYTAYPAVPLIFKCGSSVPDIYGVLQFTQNSGTFQLTAATDVVVTLVVEQL